MRVRGEVEKKYEKFLDLDVSLDVELFAVSAVLAALVERRGEDVKKQKRSARRAAMGSAATTDLRLR